MRNVQHGVVGFMTPTVKTFRMNPAISAWAAVNSGFLNLPSELSTNFGRIGAAGRCNRNVARQPLPKV